MTTFVFLGSYAEVRGVKLERFGQRIELEQAEGEHQVRDQFVGLLPASDFAKAGITDAELEKYHAVGLHSLAPAEFIKKRDAAWKALAEYRARLTNPQTTKDGE